MNKLIISSLMLVSMITFSAPGQVMHWGDLASIKRELIEDKARTFLLREKPELKNVAVKFVQIDAQIHKNEGTTLNVVFIHANSFKPIEKSELYDKSKNSSEIKYCMEFIFIFFQKMANQTNWS
ncbi:hypothetical protein P4S60_07355 [Pseudoalteromonas sp. Hal040]|uniref:hypothetical protein n=1 Tax=unclassified Pseudoalteromonas TaxID=194690 RepID=UPI00301DCF26